jgi:hypothetical protein
MKIHRIVSKTFAEGPGCRFCIWVQGCKHHCKGCFATDTWDLHSGTEYTPQQIVEQLEKVLSGTLERGNGQIPDVKYWAKHLNKAFLSGSPIKRDYTRKFAIPGTEKPGEKKLTDSSMRFLLDDAGIKCDIDLRSDYECFGMKGSPLGDKVKWLHYPSLAYAGVHTEKGKDAFRNVFRVFLDECNYPILFHCIAGQDRTGTVAFILNGLLGVDEEELYRDWEVSAFWNMRMNFCHKHKFDKLVKSFDSMKGETLHDRIASFVRSLGFTDADIEKFRSIMLEGYSRAKKPI